VQIRSQVFLRKVKLLTDKQRRLRVLVGGCNKFSVYSVLRNDSCSWWSGNHTLSQKLEPFIHVEDGWFSPLQIFRLLLSFYVLTDSFFSVILPLQLQLQLT